jgi:hypothetical protein
MRGCAGPSGCGAQAGFQSPDRDHRFGTAAHSIVSKLDSHASGRSNPTLIAPVQTSELRSSCSCGNGTEK